MSPDVISIAGRGLSASINPLGAELSSLRDETGRDLLWNGDPAVWPGRAPILFPIIGTLNGDTYRVDGNAYTLPRHGFGRRRKFALAESGADHAVFRLEADDETRAVYPFEFRLDLNFSMSGNRLDISADIVNTGSKDMPASFGYHPAFLWPLPYGAPRADYRIAFEREEKGPLRLLNAQGLLEPAPLASPIKGHELLLRDDLFTKDALIFTELASRSVIYGAGEGPRLKISFPNTPHLGIWSKPGAPFVCIEPWQGHSDPAGFDGEIWDKPGIVRIKPGAERRWRMGVELISD
ncbi:aldose 1-epimerase [Terrihabitans soli]|uniref:Aldose 1-epimerase n=1 Tax=Terrihabitans soli TaxID=708113 RepID=A0A6S6QJT4_9HYPH|nr:aldose 1-epimerase family protein [Terrihabitans soli]BCJ91553.1 aldose 1-epimerase [Terrihabitans soli]